MANEPSSDWERHNDSRYRAPVDLAVTRTPIANVLVVGSCLVETLPQHIAGKGARADFISFNFVADVPSAPPRPLAEYDFQFVQVPLRSVWPERAYLRLGYDDVAAYESLFAHAEDRLEQMLAAGLRYNRESGILTFVPNFFTPQQNPVGRLLPRYDLRNPVHMIERLNQRLAAHLSEYRNVRLVDADQIAATLGRRYLQDDSVCILGHGTVLSDAEHVYDRERIEPLAPIGRHYVVRPSEFVEMMWAEVEAMYRTIRGLDQVKLVAVDLDDTLWRGTFAETGTITGGTLEGWPLGFGEALHFLKQRGVLLAIVSKNDEAKIRAVWDDLFLGRLGWDDFACKRINWRPKSENLDEILAEVNVLPRSTVFIDDNPREREEVEARFPEVRTLGSNPYYLRRILLWAPETQVPFITGESLRRTEMVHAQLDRNDARSRLSREEFLASLDLKVQVERIAQGDLRFGRACELVNKTNQFNTTGKRWAERDWDALFARGGALYGVVVEDRFAHNGLAAAGILAGGVLEQFVMSCRVVGLGVEVAAVAWLCREAQRGGWATVAARCNATGDNVLARDLYERCGFTLVNGLWHMQHQVPVPAHIELVEAPHARGAG